MMRNFSAGYSSPFVGRTKERADIIARLENPACRLITLTGLGGSGKTRLAVETAHAAAHLFADGTVFIGLQPLTKTDLVVSNIAQAFGLTLYGEVEPETQLFNHLADKSLLLVLDNFEHLLSGAALISTMLGWAPGVKILVTSREVLNLQEEWLYPLRGMEIPLSTYSMPLEDYEAVQLFLYHARRIQPDFKLENEGESIIRICEMTAGLPLAIELAASWLKGLTAAQISLEMRHNLDFLSTTTRNIEDRHRSMRAVFDHSWKLLSDAERMIFARLSVFRGGFDPAAAEQVAGAALPVLVGLVEKSLIQVESSYRFGIHELLRQYGLEKLDAFGDIEATYARHSAYFAQLLSRYETALKQPQQLEAMQMIESDFENILLAWDWSVKNQHSANLGRMLNGLYLFGFLSRRHLETLVMFQHSLETPIDDTPLFGRLLARRWGQLHWWYQPDYMVALNSIEQALAIARAQDDSFETAFCHLMAAYALISMQRYTDALPHLEASKALFEAIDEPFYVCWVLHRLGYVYASLGDVDKEMEYLEQGLSLARVTQNRFSLVSCLYNLGSVHVINHNAITGMHYGTEALQLATETGQQCQLSHALSLLALHAFYQGNYDACRDYAERSQMFIKDIILLVLQPYSLSLLIFLACMREDYAEGVRLNDLVERHSTDAIGFQLLYCALAALSCGLGSLADAQVHIEKFLHLTDSDIQFPTTILTIPSAAVVLAETNPVQSVELLAWVLSYPDTALNWARQWALLERLQVRLRAAMDTASFEKHWEKGKALTFDAVDAYLRHEFRTPSDGVREVPSLQVLSARETEILRLIAVGLTNPQIAEQLVIGVGTVKTHTLSIYRKLDVANRTQAIVRAQELGILHA